MNRCLCCDKKVEDSFNSLIRGMNKICRICLNSFKIRNKRFRISGCKGIVLYYYDDFFKGVLFRYKGMGDYVLKDIFLLDNYMDIKRRYKGYSVVVAPSNKSIEKRRGFCHLEEIFKSLGMPIIKCFTKTCEWKQSDKRLEERYDIQNVIKIDKSLLNGVKKVLIVDDVLTSGSTIKAMISQMPANIEKKVLVLASNCRIKANEIV